MKEEGREENRADFVAYEASSLSFSNWTDFTWI